MMSLRELYVDMPKEKRALIVTKELEDALPNLVPSFETVDRRYFEDREGYLSHIEDSLFVLKRERGAEVACSLMYDDRSKTDEILVIFAPFADVEPRSDSEVIYEYTRLSKPGFMDKQKAKPNSWNQATKSKTVFELMAALGHGVPVLTIFSPIPPRSFSRSERKDFRREGDFQPAAQLTEEAVSYAQMILHGSKSETKIDKIHVQGGSLGASNAIGAAAGIARENKKLQVLTVTAQELIMGPDNLFDLAKRFTVRQYVGEPPESSQPDSYTRIVEPALRRAIDVHGNEIAMLPRMIHAMSKLSYLIGLTRPETTAKDIEGLMTRGVQVTVPLGINSSLGHQTPDYLPKGDDRLDIVKVRGQEGQMVGHLINEHVALTAGATALGISKSGKK